ncbi:hypothetical protein EVJ50_09480 [Synechococcus sp. RSCCF101]|uniref:hypothetical protein n=1 Tax=Synechococcus sp. RSCCF101 TaxID=2511069 RepID=UPI0012457EE7|nr:hypothetical protein [Synechococcus sp. RSCCF101]QEY32412.1 hypothetical protein EVJ50_09480 [Synechococcus sp. RSCCF101]
MPADANNPFIIYSSARTGSNQLIQWLNRHPLIQCHYEVYSPNNVYTLPPRPQEMGLRDQDPVAFMQRLFTDAAKPVVGFKIFPDQCEAVITASLQDRCISKLILYRANVLAQHASMEEALLRNRWVTLKSDLPQSASDEGQAEDTEQDAKPSFDADRFERFAAKIAGFYAHLMEQLLISQQPALVFEYTQIFNPLLVENLAASLIAPSPAAASTGRVAIDASNRHASGHHKTGSFVIPDRFSNPHTVLDHLTATGQMHYAIEVMQTWSPAPQPATPSRSPL